MGQLISASMPGFKTKGSVGWSVFRDNYASRLTTADVDLDGDLAWFSVSFSGRHGASWYENVSGLEGFQGHSISLEFHFPLDWFNSSIVDFDEDGDLDIVYFVDHHFGWLENTGAAAGFVEHQLLETEYAAFDLSIFFGIAAGDISGDGKPDLVLVNQDAQSVVWYRSEIPGDSSQDGRFDTTDFVQVFQAGKYGSDLRRTSKRATGMAMAFLTRVISYLHFRLATTKWQPSR